MISAIGDLLDWAPAFALVIARVAPAMALLPGLGERAAPGVEACQIIAVLLRRRDGPGDHVTNAARDEQQEREETGSAASRRMLPSRAATRTSPAWTSDLQRVGGRPRRSAAC